MCLSGLQKVNFKLVIAALEITQVSAERMVDQTSMLLYSAMLQIMIVWWLGLAEVTGIKD